MSKTTAFLLGALLASLLLRTVASVDAQGSIPMYGTFGGVPKAIAVNSSGYVNVTVH